jgi:hypothetical protein
MAVAARITFRFVLIVDLSAVLLSALLLRFAVSSDVAHFARDSPRIAT